ncbi:MAG: PaaI family thioesterase [Acidimicrobiia bacterium]
MNEQPDREAIADALRGASESTLPGHLGFELVEISEDGAHMRCEVQAYHHAPNGYLHAGAVVALADTAAGFGCVGNWPEGATGFTTIELKSNFTGTLLEGAMVAKASMIHGGRTTQVWDVVVSSEADGSVIAYFRATQLILYPKD